MSGIMEKKGKTIGTGKPLICVPVTEKTKEGIIKEIQILTEKKTEMIEWRMDWFEQVREISAVTELLEAVRPKLKDTLFLVTFRSKNQGGEQQLSTQETVRLNKAAAKTGVPDFVDMEYFEYEEPERAVRMLKDCGVTVICSHHDFEKTPETPVMQKLLEKMQQGGADIAKLAVMPKNKEDVLRLLSITENFTQNYPNTPVITMSMGKDGVISRLSGEIFGSCVTFGSHKKASAPGQMQMDDLETVLEKIHKSMY